MEAGYETIGDLMLALKLDENKVLALAGVGPKALENMHERLAEMEFPELVQEPQPEPQAPEAVVLGESEVAQAELPVEAVVAAEAVETAGELRPSRGRDEGEQIEPENAKDGVSLDELFQMKPEIFRTTPAEEDTTEKKKDKKKKDKKNTK